MVYTKLFSNKISTEKSTGMIFFLVMVIGSICGILLGRLQCLSSCIRLPPLQDLVVIICERQFIPLIAVDCVFSILLLLSSLAGHKKIFFLFLFFLKSFCISYFLYLFVYFFRIQGFVIAFSVLLLHGFLLLPLQLTSVYLILTEQHPAQRKPRFSVLCISNLAAAFCCAVAEFFAIPAIFSAHLSF